MKGLVYALCQGNYEGRHPEGIKYFREFPSRLRLQVPYCRECKLKKAGRWDYGLNRERRQRVARKT
jgi:hypothetical protein